MEKTYAHSAKGKPVDKWEELPDHLEEVGRDTAHRATKFGCASLGAVLGNLHDFGKFKPAFQRYLHDPTVKGKGHSTAGAVYAVRTFHVLGKVIAHAIAGHHSGLKDGLLAKMDGWNVKSMNFSLQWRDILAPRTDSFFRKCLRIRSASHPTVSASAVSNSHF